MPGLSPPLLRRGAGEAGGVVGYAPKVTKYPGS